MPGGKAWYALENKDFTGLAKSRQLLTDWLVSLEASTGVPLNKTVLAGFSQGGALTLDVGLTLPFAALCSFSGYLHDRPQVEENKNFPPTLIIHGKQDPVVPLAAAIKARDELAKIGVPVQYREFEMGHEVCDEAIALFKQFISDLVLN